MEVDKWVSKLQNKIRINLKKKNTDKKENSIVKAHKRKQKGKILIQIVIKKRFPIHEYSMV